MSHSSRPTRLGFLALLLSLLFTLPGAAWAQGAPPKAPQDGGVAPVHTANDGAKKDAQAAKAPQVVPKKKVDKRISLAALKRQGADLGSTWIERFQSLLGMLVLLGVCFLMSNNRQRISWRVVGWGMALQLTLGFLVMKTSLGHWFFDGVNTLFVKLTGYTNVGASFLFGKLALGDNVPVGTGGVWGPISSHGGNVAAIGAAFAFGVLPTIIFFSSLMAVLYHLGVMQFIVKGVAYVMQRTMGTSGSETLSASGNIFVGQTEAPLLVRPFVQGMTESELMAVMTGGFATVAGGVMAAYVAMLSGYFKDIAGHLLSASVMSAPAALVCAKLMIPEPHPERSETYGELKVKLDKVDVNVIDAAARGAGDGLSLALNVGAMLLAFIALIAMFNGGLNFVSNELADAIYGAPWSARLAAVQQDFDSQQAKATPDAKALAADQATFVALAQEALGKKDLQAEFEPGRSTPAAYDAQGRLHFGPRDLDPKQPKVLGVKADVPTLSAYRGGVATDADLGAEGTWRSLNFQMILGWLLAPLAWLMGVPWADAGSVGQLIGIKTVVNEFVAYGDLAGMLGRAQFVSPRSVVIATYALCGFSNFSSIAIQIGGIGGIAPSRRQDLSRLGLRAMIAGTIACLLTATVAGLLI